MRSYLMDRYSPEVQEKMKKFYENLSEKDKRHYAAIEAIKLGHGGAEYISRLFDCSRQTIYKGIEELGKNELLPSEQCRAPGGGRKGYRVKHSNIDEIFLKGD